MNRNEKPRKVFMAGLILSMVLAMILVTGFHRDDDDGPQSYSRDFLEESATSLLSIEATDTLWAHTTLICTTRIASKDPLISVQGSMLRYIWEEDGMTMEDWQPVPAVPYGTRNWPISMLLPDMTPEAAGTLQIGLDTEYQWEQPLEEYTWLSDDHTVAREELLSLWQKKVYSQETVRIDTYDQDRVTYTVTPDSRSGAYLYGEVLIQLMDGDHCVFAATDTYDSGEQELPELTETWRIPCQLPHWSTVTVTRLL